jgi:plasmid stabilization system protein ParE
VRRIVRVLRSAQRDLDEIARYLRREAPGSAGRLIDRLLHAIEALEASPDRGASPRDPRLGTLGFRFLVEGSYLAFFYKVRPTQVRIYRVLHGSRAYEGLL